jgi:thiamine-phosphate pyrophosphorylase
MMQLYAITNSLQRLPGVDCGHSADLEDLACSWARGGVDFIQIREKLLPPEELFDLTRRMVAAVGHTGATTRVLLNGPADLALAAGAHGVHLPGDASVNATKTVRALYAKAGKEAIISRACHSLEDVQDARQASVILYAPVYEKVIGNHIIAGQGLASLQLACRATRVPVFALGGITRANAAACIEAGAAGIAGIRLFAEKNASGREA